MDKLTCYLQSQTKIPTLKNLEQNSDDPAAVRTGTNERIQIRSYNGHREKKAAPMTNIKLPNNRQYRLSMANDQFGFVPELKDHILRIGKGDETLVEEISK